MRKDILRAAVLLPALAALLVALPACGSHSSIQPTSTKVVKSKPARSLVLIDAKTGALDLSFPDADSVNTTIADNKGGWYVSGLTRVGKTARNDLAHLRSDGSLDSAFAPTDLPRNDSAQSILLHRNVIFAGYYAHGVFALDARTGKRLWRVSTNGSRVTSLAYWKGVLYVGGAFEHVGGANRSGIAAIDAATGKPTSWRVRISAIVASVGIWKGVVYIGGMFDSVSGEKRPLGLAALSSRTGQPTSWVPRSRGGAGSIDSIDKVSSLTVRCW